MISKYDKLTSPLFWCCRRVYVFFFLSFFLKLCDLEILAFKSLNDHVATLCRLGTWYYNLTLKYLLVRKQWAIYWWVHLQYWILPWFSIIRCVGNSPYYCINKQKWNNWILSILNTVSLSPHLIVTNLTPAYFIYDIMERWRTVALVLCTHWECVESWSD
jgi:hypothetical protein